MNNGFLPVTAKEMKARGWDGVDFVYVSGDAYVDHPSFGHAIITRLLEAHGYRVGMIAQPDWKDPESVAVFGRPALGFLVSAGNMDSMVNHYYVSGRRRESDAYSPGGQTGRRPDHAAVVYGNLIRRRYGDVPVILGGIEASLRRLAHYDYWSDTLKRSILLDSQADLISYGMGERSILAIAEALKSGLSVRDLVFIPGTVYRTRDISGICESILLPSFVQMQREKRAYAESFLIQYENTDPYTGHTLLEEYPDGVYVVQNPPSLPLTMQEMDDIYEFPYMRACHPSYESAGGVPAIREIRFSLTSCRGCFGGCSFCALTFHQGRIIQARSHDSLCREAEIMIRDPEFKGYLHDVGGPTANFRAPSCEKQLVTGVCKNRQCLYPSVCPGLTADHSDYLALLRRLRALPGVKKVFIRSGIRFDYLMADADDTFFRELVEHHISGQLKVAPEHIADVVLARMGKPRHKVYEAFAAKYQKLNGQLGKKQFLVPYLMSSHPGSTLKEAIALAEYLRDQRQSPEQVQDFYPTPSTLSTVMYYTGIDPRNGQHVYVCKNPHEKAMQRALIQYRDPKNRALVREALTLAGRRDLIGFGPACLIRPGKNEQGQEHRQEKKNTPDKKRRHKKKKTIRNIHKKRKQGDSV